LGDWNNTGSTATGVYTKGGGANGIRPAGARNVSISKVIVEDKTFGWSDGYGRSAGTTEDLLETGEDRDESAQH